MAQLPNPRPQPPCSWGAGLADKPHGYALLHLAAGVGALPAVTFLLESGADPNGGFGGGASWPPGDLPVP